MEIGREALGLYILDKSLIEDVKFPSTLFAEYSTIDCEPIPKIFCNHASQLSNF